MTRCIEEGLLKAYIDNSLSEAERAEVNTHMSGCEACQTQVKELERLSAQVGTLLATPVTALDADAALARLRYNQRRQHEAATAHQEVASLAAHRGKASRLTPIWRMRPAMAGMGLAVVMVAVLALLFMLGDRQPKASPSAPFVPPGKVRHLVITHTHTKPGAEDRVLTEEVWLGRGKSHLLMYSTILSEGMSTWVEEDAVYSHGIASLDKRRVLKYPYHEKHLELYVPNEISYLLTLPHARITGESTLDGRPVTMIEALADRSNPSDFNWDGSAVTDYKFWVDKETLQVLQRQHSTTFLSGNRNGITETQTFKVTRNELKDASEVPADLFKFKLPAGAEVVEAPSPFAKVTPTVPGAQWSEFVPQGKVRQLRVSHSWQWPSNNDSGGKIENVWLTAGKQHPLLRTEVRHVDVGGTMGFEAAYSRFILWVDEDAVYRYSKYGDVYHKYDYDPRFLEPYLPQKIDDLLAMPDARIVGDETFNGRAVTLIESVKSKPSEIPPPDPNVPETSVTDVKLWYDKETSLVIKRESTTTYLSGRRSNTTVVETIVILSNELKDASEFAHGFFEPPPSAKSVETESDPLAQSTPGAVGIEPTATPDTSLAQNPDFLPAGSAAPDFELADVRTNQVVKLSSLRGKPVMLMFWGTWCPPCRDSMTQVKRAYNKWRGSVEFISLSSGPRDQLVEVRDFVKGDDYPWTFLHDLNGMAVFTQYQAFNVPLFYFVDPAGTIKDIHVGLLSTDEAIDAPLRKIAPANPPGVPADGIPGWYVFTSPHGAFSVLMPRQLVDAGSRDGWEMFGVKNGDVTYMATYRDYPEVRNSNSREEWLDQQLAVIIGEMGGTSRDVKSIELSGYRGRELTIVRADGRLARSRVYLVGTRVYNVYAIAANEKVANSEEVERYLDSFKLLEP